MSGELDRRGFVSKNGGRSVESLTTLRARTRESLPPTMSIANSKAVGEKTEGIILGHLMRLGRVVLVPFGNNQRYDLVVDLGEGQFLRGQCKTAVLRNGCVIFHACSTNGFTGEKKGYRGQVDVFWVYCPDNDKVYEVPVDSVGETQVALRVEAPKPKGNHKRIRWAKDFEI